MKLLVLKEEIIDGLQKAAGIIPMRTGAAFLRTIWLRAEEGALQILSTDSNLEFSGRYPAKVEEGGLVGVQGRRLYDLLRKLPPGEMMLTMPKEDSLQITQGRRSYRLPTSESSWFQEFASFPGENTVLWSGDYLRDLIDRIAFCISDEDNMEAMKCMKLTPKSDNESVEVCGLNGHQFAMATFLNEDIHALLPDKGILVHKKYLMELKKWVTFSEVEIAISQKRLFCSSDERRETFSLPLSEYDYPQYQAFLKDMDNATTHAVVDRLELMDALERINVFNTDNQICAFFHFNQNELTLFAEGHDVGEAKELLNVEYAGTVGKIAFPTRKFIDILSRFESDSVRMDMLGELSPCMVTGKDDARYLIIVMPMEVAEETYYTEEKDA